MNCMKIVSFSGRKECGKTYIGKIYKIYNYKIKSFASPLKDLVSRACGITEYELEKLKNTNELVQIDTELLATELKIDLYLIKQILNEKKYTIRSILQKVGTEIIRQHVDNDWHVKQIKLDKKYNYVFTDCRFKNEYNFLKSLGAEMWFIIRPFGYSSLSNHASETELKWTDFDNVSINDNSQDYKKEWIEYIETGICYNQIPENILKEYIYSETRKIISKGQASYCLNSLLSEDLKVALTTRNFDTNIQIKNVSQK